MGNGDSMKVVQTTIDGLIGRYHTLLFDAYGVLVNSRGAISGAAELIDMLNRTGKPYHILTNDASKLPSTAADWYKKLGLAIDSDRIITSGSLLVDHFKANGLVGKRCVVLGPDDSVRYAEIAGGLVVQPGETFDVAIIGDETGYPFVETVDTVLSELFRKIDRGEQTYLVQPNPDLIYPKDEYDFGMASECIALIFEAALKHRYPDRPDLRFDRLGKPYAPIFEKAFQKSGTKNMVMIGDQLETDIRGANDYGIDSALVGTGLANLEVSLPGDHPCPTFYMRSLLPKCVSSNI